MANAFFQVPVPFNEPVKSYAPGTAERAALKAQLAAYKATTIDVPMVINGKPVHTDNKVAMHPPHEIKHLLGHYSKGDASHVHSAIEAALGAKEAWENTSWEHRAAVFLKAAELLEGPYRAKINASTMLAQSKNAYQAEIDAACELIDFFRYNVQYMTDLYSEQPESNPGMWNRLEHRPLEGFVFAITPFNFTSICANLCAAPAMMGNVVVWKPADAQIYSAKVIMDLFKDAGLPDGVINLILTDGPEAGDVIFNHKEFAGLHFTGSTGVFQSLWKTIGNNIHKYNAYPRIVGETGGKDYIMVHPSADAAQVATALVRGSFEYQGQKCSASSRAYIPKSLWPLIEPLVKKDVASMKVGTVENFSNFINAVITEASFDKIVGYIEQAKKDDGVEIVTGGTYDKSEGYFIHPTILRVDDPKYRTMCEELFGPVLTLHVYEDEDFDHMLDVLDDTSPYALTGALFAVDRLVIEKAAHRLRHTAGNFYINDKPTGAVVGQQPFGGGRASGTNDKAGSILNLLRWVSPRTIKETFNAPINYRYPFLQED